MSDSVLTDGHRTVLLGEAVDALAIRPEGLYVDATFGRGGHSRAILGRLGPAGRLIAFDKDPAAVAAAGTLADPRFSIVHGSFAGLREELAQRGIEAVDGILMDLGVSSPQLDEAARGFSFRADGPLDMRMNPQAGESAAQWLARASVEELKEVIADYGEERFALSVAKAIVARRALRPIDTTRDLAAIVADAVKTREKGQDPATRTFQAIRIHVNQELAELPLALEQALALLKPGGRLAVISFHSLEDRIVKRFVQTHAKPPVLPARLPLRAAELPTPPLVLIDKIKPSAEEVVANPRARSAILRVAAKREAAC
jgi:16S rRNA (cytosine1402-N4)-methyltransferase